MIFALILLVLLGLSMLLNFGQLAGSVMRVGGSRSVASSRYVGPRLDENILEENSASTKIAVIDVKGIITDNPVSAEGYSMVDIIKAQLDRAQDDRKVKAVILRVDSPGGEVLASDEISDAIKNFQNGKKSNGSDADKSEGKPVIVSMGNLAASGGYYISAPCRYIVANKMTITGSIGVIMHGYNYRGLLNKVGVVPEVYKSGKFKDMMSPDREPGDITQEETQHGQEPYHGGLRRLQRRGRDGPQGRAREKQIRRPCAGGELDRLRRWPGVVRHGSRETRLCGRGGEFPNAVKHAKILGGISGDANLIQYQERYDLSDFFHMFGESKAQGQTVKLDLGFDAPRLQEGHLYFLSPALSH